METESSSPTEVPKTKKLYQVSWGPLTAIVVTISIYFGSQIVGGLVIAAYPFLRHWTKHQTNSWLNHSSYAQFIFEIIVEVVTVGAVWWFLKHCKAKPSDIGLKRPKWVDIGYALAGFGAYFVIYILALSILTHIIPGLNTNQKQDLGFNTSATGLALVVAFLGLVVIPPLVEEILVRGFLYTGLRSKLPVIVSALITSLIFASAHLQFGSGAALLWTAGIDTFILSLVLIYLRQKTDRLWASILVHALKNGVAFFTLFVLHVNK